MAFVSGRFLVLFSPIGCWLETLRRVRKVLLQIPHIVSLQTIIPLNGFHIYYFSIIFIEQPEKIVGYFRGFRLVGDARRESELI